MYVYHTSILLVGKQKPKCKLHNDCELFFSSHFLEPIFFLVRDLIWFDLYEWWILFYNSENGLWIFFFILSYSWTMGLNEILCLSNVASVSISIWICVMHEHLLTVWSNTRYVFIWLAIMRTNNNMTNEIISAQPNQTPFIIVFFLVFSFSKSINQSNVVGKGKTYWY